MVHKCLSCLRIEALQSNYKSQMLWRISSEPGQGRHRCTRREPVPPFGAWRLEDPSSPVVDYEEVFTRARASRLGCTPQENYEDEEYYSQSDDTPRYRSGARAMTRHPRKNFFQYFACGARTQAVA